jgi:hypothetical protein
MKVVPNNRLYREAKALQTKLGGSSAKGFTFGEAIPRSGETVWLFVNWVSATAFCSKPYVDEN